MPELDGYGVLAELRANPETVMIPVVFLTAKGDYDSLRQGMKLGADDYLTKPVESKELVATIEAQLEKRSQLNQHYQASCLTPSEVNATTGLPGLLALETQFYQALEAAPQGCHRLTLLKLNNYTHLQESFGHVFGVQVLKALAQRLQQWQATPVKGLADVGAERFVMLTASDGDSVCEPQLHPDLQETLAAPVCINNQEIMPEWVWQTTTVMAGSDFNQSLLRVMKLSPRRRSTMGDAVPSGSWASRLRQALAQDEFELNFQPQVNLKTGQITGAEVLLRWHSPTGTVSPAVFIPAAEENDLIGEIGDWVLHNACQQLGRWHTQEIFALTLAINLSAKQLQQPNFQQQLIQTVEQYGISPALIDLELTESVLITQPDSVSRLLKDLQQVGFSVAIDDFGTGYSSLGYLHQLPVNILKIDKCFVRNLDKNMGNMVIVKAIVDMAHGLNVNTIAEGVETAEELAVLQQFDCEAMQGYLYSPPLSVDAFEQLLQTEREKRGVIVNRRNAIYSA